MNAIIHNDEGFQKRQGMRCELDAFVAEVLKNPEAKAAYDNATARHAILDTLYAKRLTDGLSAREVARRMGVSDATVRRLEHEGSDPTISLVQLYAGAVGYTLQLDLKEADKK